MHRIRKISETRYQKRLSSTAPVTVIYDGKKNPELTEIINDNVPDYINREWARGQKNTKEMSLAILRKVEDIRTKLGTQSYYARKFQPLIDEIEKNPNLSITKFLKEMYEKDPDGRSWHNEIVSSAREVAKQAGRRANIKDVLAVLQKKQKPYIDRKEKLTRTMDMLKKLDLDKLEIGVPKGVLFEVDIPENDVLLDEDKPLSEQPPKVQEALKKCGERVGVGKFIDYNGNTYRFEVNPKKIIDTNTLMSRITVLLPIMNYT